jgi:cytochrome oxidase assembly protein ShyY1
VRATLNILPTLAALVVGLTTARLGVWQLQRYATSAERSTSMIAAWEREPLVELTAATPEDLHFRRATLRGRWVPNTGMLVRGTPIAGNPGYEFVSLLALDPGKAVLVDRGWVPTTVTAAELGVLYPAEEVQVEGLLVPVEGNRDLRGAKDPDGIERWPLEMDLLWGVFPRAVGLPFASMAAAADVPVAPVALLLGPRLEEETERRARTLPAPGYVLPLPRTHHLSYAAQWFAFSALTAAIWLWHSFRPWPLSQASNPKEKPHG